MKDVGAKKKELLERVGMLAIADLVDKLEPPEGFTTASFNTLKSKLPSTIPPTAPPPIDHRKHDNSYISLHGDEWLNRIKSTTTFARACSTRDLALHIVSETEKAFENTACSNNCYFHHDALTQMNNPETIR